MLTTYAMQIIAVIRISFADRINFFLQMAGMAVNNGFFFLLWILFFAGFRNVGGWQFADVCLLLGIIMTVVGIAGILFGGYRDMAAAILRGEADALLTQPKPVLARLLARESFAHAWGALVTGIAMLATLAGLDAARMPLAMLAVGLGLIVYVSASVAFASLAFWIAGAVFQLSGLDLYGRDQAHRLYHTSGRLCRACPGGTPAPADVGQSRYRRGCSDWLCDTCDVRVPPGAQTIPTRQDAHLQLLKRLHAPGQEVNCSIARRLLLVSCGDLVRERNLGVLMLPHYTSCAPLQSSPCHGHSATRQLGAAAYPTIAVVPRRWRRR